MLIPNFDFLMNGMLYKNSLLSNTIYGIISASRLAAVPIWSFR